MANSAIFTIRYIDGGDIPETIGEKIQETTAEFRKYEVLDMDFENPKLISGWAILKSEVVDYLVNQLPAVGDDLVLTYSDSGIHYDTTYVSLSRNRKWLEIISYDNHTGEIPNSTEIQTVCYSSPAMSAELNPLTRQTVAGCPPQGAPVHALAGWSGVLLNRGVREGLRTSVDPSATG